MPQFRARSLRTALFATALLTATLTAVALPAPATQAAPGKPAARVKILKAGPRAASIALVKPYDLTVDAAARVTDGPSGITRTGTGAATGSIQWRKGGAANQGEVCDRGDGHTVVTFTYHRTLARDVVRRFAIFEGCGSTAHRVRGTFGQITVRVEKILPTSSLKTWRHAWA